MNYIYEWTPDEWKKFSNSYNENLERVLKDEQFFEDFQKILEEEKAVIELLGGDVSQVETVENFRKIIERTNFMNRLKIHCDGLCEPNPGKASWAFVVFDENGGSVHLDCGYLGDGKTNNVAEYTAVGKAAAWASENAKSAQIEILTDSMLVVNQVNGEWKTNDNKLLAFRNRVKELFESHGNIKLGWVKGTENQADILTRKAYLDAVGSYPKPRIKKAA